jgi:hypothetical protein
MTPTTSTALEMAPPLLRYYGGADFGQATDFTAVAIVERTDHPDPDHPARTQGHYACRHLERLKLGTPYPQIVERLKEMYAELPLKNTDLALDYTGCGRPIVDVVRASDLRASLWPVTITGGLTISVKELQTFSVKITPAGNETFEAWRERDHDDMVLALGFACWVGERAVPWECPSSVDVPQQSFWQKVRSLPSPMARLYGRNR